MVIVNKLEREPEPEPTPDFQFNLIEVYFELPCAVPESEPCSARPYEFADDGTPTAYATTCCYCGAGNFLHPKENLCSKFGLFFGQCSECGVGATVEADPFEDPFQNPIKNNKIAVEDIDPDISSDTSDQEKTASEKLPREAFENHGEPSDNEHEAEQPNENEGQEEEEEAYEDYADVMDDITEKLISGDEHNLDNLDNLDDESKKLLDLLNQDEHEV